MSQGDDYLTCGRCLMRFRKGQPKRTRTRGKHVVRRYRCGTPGCDRTYYQGASGHYPGVPSFIRCWVDA